MSLLSKYEVDVAASVGAWTSVSRKSALPVFEELNMAAYFTRFNMKAKSLLRMFSTRVRRLTSRLFLPLIT